MKMLGDLWQHYPKRPEILSNYSGSEKWMWLSVIANQTSRDPGLAKRCLKRAYMNILTKLNRKLEVNMWYTSRDFQLAKKLLDNSCTLLEKGINHEAISLKWYRGLVMSLGYYPGVDDHAHTNRLCTISPSVLLANHEIPIPPPSPNKHKMLPPPTPPLKGKEKETDGVNVGFISMDLANNGSEDGTCTPSEKQAGMIMPAPPVKEASKPHHNSGVLP